MKEITQMDAAGLDFLILNEGIRLKPYLDSVGIPTIGVGNTYYANGKRVTMKDKAITKPEAMELFKLILKHYEMAVYSCTRDDINQNQFNALVSFTYNVGVSAYKDSTVRKRINNKAPGRDIESAFMMWRRPAAIIKRRQREADLFLKP